jgi:hypothetical protein
MKKYSRQDQMTMAAWAADCAERVLPLFEKAYPEDGRPRNAIETCRGGSVRACSGWPRSAALPLPPMPPPAK